MKKLLLAAVLLAVVTLSGCTQEGGQKATATTPTPSKEELIAEKFEKSLHFTRQGKAYFYAAENGGFESLTGIPISELGCLNCHAKTKADGTPIDPATYKPDCYDCHVTPGDKPSQEICLGCHGRQATEIKLSAKSPLFSDVHRDKGMTCTDCHTEEDVHGDGKVYNSMREGAIKADCENCHTDVPSNTAHNIHMEKVSCEACHVQTVISCYNCHIESLIEAHSKRPYGPLSGFKLLVNFDGKVTSATFMAVQYKDKTFYVVSPFYSHTVSRNVECSDCHGNEALKEYDETGRIVITKWNETAGKLEWKKGVIPLVPDWQNAFVLDFLNYTGDPHNPVVPFTDGNWTYLKTGADKVQMLFGEPLTQEQLEKLRMKVD